MRSELYRKQERHFVLYSSGQLKYYDVQTGEHRGTFQLRDDSEIVQQSAEQLYFFVQGTTVTLFTTATTTKDQTMEIESWVQVINSVVTTL